MGIPWGWNSWREYFEEGLFWGLIGMYIATLCVIAFLGLLTLSAIILSFLIWDTSPLFFFFESLKNNIILILRASIVVILAGGAIGFVIAD